MTFTHPLRIGCGVAVVVFAATAPWLRAQDMQRDDALAETSAVCAEAESEANPAIRPEPTASSQEATSTHYLQYEPQNAPLSSEPPSLIEQVPPVAVPPQKPPPPIAPYSTQFAVTWNSGSGDGLGIVDFDLRETLVFPRVKGLLVTPGFASHLLSGPESTDLPAALYDNWVEIRWLKAVNEDWSLDLAITPGLYTDYDNLSSDAVRIQARALALWKASTAWQLAFGFVYLDREDIAALPVAGLIWTPSPTWKTELVFPRPRLLYRWSHDGERSQWIYLAGEFGGGSWAIRRAARPAGPGVVFPPGVLPNQTWDDVVTYSVMRLLVGWEVNRPKGFAPRLEAGFSFQRSIEYESGFGDYEPDPAAIVRLGGSF